MLGTYFFSDLAVEIEPLINIALIAIFLSFFLLPDNLHASLATISRCLKQYSLFIHLLH